MTIVKKERFEIFQGKKAAKYNELILRALYEKGYLSSWELAKKIAESDPARAMKDWYHEAQKVQSVLVRKRGRLSDLVEKEFIEKTDKGYCLTFNKGFCSALVSYKEIPKPAIDETTKVAAFLPEFRKILDIISRIYPEETFEHYGIMREITISLLKKGLNFESISNGEFNDFFADQYKESYLEELKMEKTERKERETPPELKEAILDLLSHMEAMLMKQIREYSSLKNKFAESTSTSITTSTHDKTKHEPLGGRSSKRGR